MFGAPSILDLVKAQQRRETEPATYSEVGDTDPGALTGDPLVMHLRRKRRAALMKQILRNGGYGDLAKMVSFSKEES